MIVNRRDVLRGLGVGSASTLLWAMGCSGPAQIVRARDHDRADVRGWLRAAVGRLATAFPDVHALAVTRRRTTAAIDVLGAGVARGRSDGVVLTVRAADGTWHEQVTSALGAVGVLDAVNALLAGTSPSARRAGAPGFGTPRTFGRVDDDATPATADDALLARVDAMLARDRSLNSRIVYSAGAIDLDDATVWSVAPDRDFAQRVVRVRRSAMRVAWDGTRPVVSEVARGWTGGLDDHELDEDALAGATAAALELMTPGAFDDGARVIVLDPSVVAALVDAVARTLLTSAAARRPEVAARLAIGAGVAAEALTMIDDPTVRGAYGGFAFDDEGELAAPQTLVDRGHVVGRLADRAGAAMLGARGTIAAGRGRRPGHLGAVEPSASHLRLVPGAIARAALLADDGLILEGGGTAVVDPSSGRVVVAIARARELIGGRTTGRVYADVELVGELAALLGSVTAVSADTETFAVRDDLDGRPRWRSLETPSLRATGVVRARRRST